MKLFATCAFGLEKIVYQELKKLKLWVDSTEDGKVHFQGDDKAIFETNLWLRTVDRVFINLASFPAKTFDELFDGIKAMPWSSWIDQNDAFTVLAQSNKSQLTSEPAIQSISKKAIVESLKLTYNQEHFAENSGVELPITIFLKNDVCTVGLNTSGESLHRRGYRRQTVEAPIKETLAAALVLLSDWKPATQTLIDPFCGSGTILIEAAMIALNKAPGLNRGFACQQWKWLNQELYGQCHADALQQEIQLESLNIYGIDHDETAIEIAQQNQQAVGLNCIEFILQNAENLELTPEPGCIITNPPYGHRISETAEVDELIKHMGQIAAQNPAWSWFVISSNLQFEKNFGRRADKNRKLFNGHIKCYLYQYFKTLSI